MGFQLVKISRRHKKNIIPGILIISTLTLLLLISIPSFAEEDNQNSEMEVEELIELSLEDLTKVKVVSASKKQQVITEAPSTVRVITARQIRERGYQTLEEALSDLPGMQFRNMLGLNSYVFMRGVPSQNNLILVLVDGIQINELNSGGFYGGGQYNLANVERIEVVYGPASALYGTNAISGIINIITRDPKDSSGLRANVLYGSFNTTNDDLSYGYYNEERELGFLVSGVFKTTEKADLAGDKGDDNWTDSLENFEDDYSFDAKITYMDFTSGLIFQNKQVSVGTYRRSVGTKFRDYGTLWNIRFINGYLKHIYDKFDKGSLSSQLYYRNATVLDNSVQQIVDTILIGYQVGYFRPNDLIGLESMLNYNPYERLNLIGGIVVEYENLADGYSNTQSSSPDERPPTPPEPDMENNSLLSVYAQTQYSILETMQLTAGARFDNSSYYDEVLTPRVGVVHNKGSLTAKLLYTEAFRAPKPWDFTWETGNPDLEPEEMRSMEAVLAYNVRDNLRAEATVYKNTVTNLLTKDTGILRWINRGEVKTDGLELSLNYFFHKFTPYINYTYNDSRDENGDDIPEIANHSANIGARYAFTKKFAVNISGNYLGERINPHIIPNTSDDIVDPAFVLNSVLTYSDFHNLEFQLIGKNILDTEYYHTSNRSAPSYLVSRFRQPQRTILVRLGWRFGTG
jgi:iron complex outermembrane receptor protein